MDKLQQLKKRLDDGRKKIENQKRVCLYPGCSEQAIGSHVLQAQGILKGIVDETNHFYTIRMIPIFLMEESKVFSVEKVGLNKGYKFPGFCNKHDTEIFKPIELHPVDLSQHRNRALFTYRTVCLEYRKKELYLEISKDVFKAHQEIEPKKKHFIILHPAELAVKDLSFYKSELEAELFFNGHSNFEFQALELPEKKICFSSPLSIYDRSNESTWEVDKYGHPRTDPLAISVLNFFPYNGQSQLIAATHRKYRCNWTVDLLRQLKDGKSYEKILSDLLTYRLDFWGIHPGIYDSIPADRKSEFLRESHLYWDNFDFEIRRPFNLFSI